MLCPTPHFIRGFQRLNPRIISNLTVNLFTLLMVLGLERRVSLQVVYHKRTSVHGSNK